MSAFLPESTTLAKLLNEEVKHTSAAIFVTASMDPEKVDLYLNQVFFFSYYIYYVHGTFEFLMHFLEHINRYEK